MSLKKAQKDKLERTLNTYFKEIHRVYVAGDFREESFYSSLKKLVDECTQFLPLGNQPGVLVQPKKTEVGIPDFLIKKDGDIAGYIEAKSPRANLDDTEKSEQLTKYRESLPNLILTNFLEFRLYRNGNSVDKVEVGRQSTLLNLKYPPVPEKLDLFFGFLEKFFSFSTPEIKTSSSLSIELAKKTRLLERILQEELSRDNKEVTRFYKAFQEELIETLTKEKFADLYAQTITYGLFAARMRIQDGFNRDTAWRFIPESLPLLREIFHSFTGPHFPESLLWVVDDISQVLRKADISSINREFQTTRWEEDPVINFYETFLATYNPEERQRLGVYYTPLPVVSYITTSIHKLLKSKFGKAEGLATNDVTLLDPAAGTLTFVVQAIKQVQKELEERNKAGLIKAYIQEHILPHFHAFEILVAPYTVGHFKVSMVLEEMGYSFKEGERFQFYLTNTLEMKEPKQVSFLIDLTKEGQEAKRVKEKVPILVILGNPPYSFKSVKTKFSEELLRDYKEDVRTEKKYGVLEDDYIKFIRFAHWKIEQAGKGILGFITNNSYLSGVIHRGMRKKLLETFDEIYILNLHGSFRIGERTPEGGKDENVFAIQQGVAIALYVKAEEPQKENKVYYADLWGMRSEKYECLLENDVEVTNWQELKPAEPWYFLVPKDFALQSDYEKFWNMRNIFRHDISGVQTKRDRLVVAFDRNELVTRMLMFGNLDLSDEIIKQTFRLPDGSDINLRNARELVKKENIPELVKEYHYRPFDHRWIYYSDSIVSRTRSNTMTYLFQENLAIITTRVIPETESKVAFIAAIIGDLHIISGQCYFFPLYLYSSEAQGQMFGEKERNSNFTDEFRHAIRESLGTEPSPEEIFYYIYAVLYSPTYRRRYEEFLKIDFPKIPLPNDYEAFKALSNLGKELVDLHLLKYPALQETEVGFPKGGSCKVDYVRYDEAAQRVHISKDQYFEGITKEVWEYRIGAYQVMEKYLKDRRGRKLSLDEINHYMKVAKAIRLTIGLQRTVDEVYARID
jgi:type I restriction-modification system DNA methylase subunit